MTLSMYQASVPSFIRMLTNLAGVLAKGAAHAEAKKIDPVVLGRTINMKVGGKPTTFQGLPYLLHYVLPNIYFHSTTAYNILRHNGVDVGKKDYLGSL